MANNLLGGKLNDTPKEDSIFLDKNTTSMDLNTTIQNVTNQTVFSQNSPWDLGGTIVLATLLAVFMLAAIIGNSMVLSVIIRHKGMRTRTNMFLASLATSDLMVALLDMPFSLVTVIKGDWIFGDVWCTVNGFTMAFFLITSIHNLMYISIHKYITITKPFSRTLTYKKIIVMIAFAWGWGAVCGTLTIVGLSNVEYKTGTTQCGPVYPTTINHYIHHVIIDVTCWLIPVVVMIVCYRSMFIEIKAYSQRSITHTNQEKDSVIAQQKRITITLFIVLAVFILCWTPYLVYSVYATALRDRSSISVYANAVVYLFGYMNSACNPIIYALRSPSFREGFKEIICRGHGYLTDDMLGCCADADVESLAGADCESTTDTMKSEDSPSVLRRFSVFANSLRDRFRNSPRDLSPSGSLANTPRTSVSNLEKLGTRKQPIVYRKGSAIYKNSKIIKILNGDVVKALANSQLKDGDNMNNNDRQISHSGYSNEAMNPDVELGNHDDLIVMTTGNHDSPATGSCRSLDSIVFTIGDPSAEGKGTPVIATKLVDKDTKEYDENDHKPVKHSFLKAGLAKSAELLTIPFYIANEDSVSVRSLEIDSEFPPIQRRRCSTLETTDSPRKPEILKPPCRKLSKSESTLDKSFEEWKRRRRLRLPSVEQLHVHRKHPLHASDSRILNGNKSPKHQRRKPMSKIVYV